MCKVIRGERASYFIAGAISNSASPFSKTISAFNIFRAGARKGEKYSIAARGAFKAEQEGGCVARKYEERESCSAKYVTQHFSKCYGGR
jgi:hypothetical protein